MIGNKMQTEFYLSCFGHFLYLLQLSARAVGKEKTD